MDKETRMRIRNAKTQDEILPKALERIEASEFPNHENDPIQATKYKQMRVYKTRHKKGKLGHTGITAILGWFGYEPITLWVKKRRTKEN